MSNGHSIAREPDIEATKLNALAQIIESLDAYNSRLVDIRGHLSAGFDRILGPVPPEPQTAKEVVGESPEGAAIHNIRVRLQYQLSLIVDIERETHRLSELG